MRYDQIRYVTEEQDPSLTIETRDLVAKVIDNTGLLAPPREAASYFQAAGRFGEFTHHLGYHGIRTLYDKAERRNLVVPFVSWLNLQRVSLNGIENDPVDERAWAGTARGWPVRMEAVGRGARILLGPPARDAIATARIVWLFEPGIVTDPDSLEAVTRILISFPSERVPTQEASAKAQIPPDLRAEPVLYRPRAAPSARNMLCNHCILRRFFAFFA